MCSYYQVLCIEDPSEHENMPMDCSYINRHCHFSLEQWTCALCGQDNDLSSIKGLRYVLPAALSTMIVTKRLTPVQKELYTLTRIKQEMTIDMLLVPDLRQRQAATSALRLERVFLKQHRHSELHLAAFGCRYARSQSRQQLPEMQSDFYEAHCSLQQPSDVQVCT